ncbi:MAG: hypothetical protein LBL15_03310 [Oscillospiraceae bacterium]|jgi:hypothetical protein|nr:hypothetical protein [Oscillospiraceae bacterium]
MRKAFCLFLALALFAGLTLPVSAAVNQESITLGGGSTSSSVTLSAEYELGYAVSLPSGTAEFDALAVGQTVNLGYVKVTEFVLPAGTAITIIDDKNAWADSDGETPGDDKLLSYGNQLKKGGTDTGDYAAYSIIRSADYYYHGGVDANQIDLTATIISIAQAATVGATYSDTITFTVSTSP